MKHLLALLIVIVFVSCDDNGEKLVDNHFSVIVAGTSIDCGLTLIDFLPADSARIYELSNKNGWLRYHAFGLDSTLNDVGSTLRITVRATRVDELFVCTTLAPGYPWVTVLTAEKAN